MAKAITDIQKSIPSDEEIQSENIAEILRVLSDNKEAVTNFLEIVKGAHEAGLFNILRGLLENKNEVAAVGMRLVNVAGIPTVMKNMIVAMQFLGKMDPLKTHMLLEGLGKGLDNVDAEGTNHTSVWGMTKALRDPDINASITVLLNFLKGMGTEFEKEKEMIKKEVNETKSSDT